MIYINRHCEQLHMMSEGIIFFRSYATVGGLRLTSNKITSLTDRFMASANDLISINNHDAQLFHKSINRNNEND